MGERMPPSRRQRWARWRHPASARAMVVGYWLVRHTLQEAGLPAETASQDWNTNRHGKPRLADSHLHFSLAHTVQIQACVVDDQPIGVDVEMISEDAVAAVQTLFGEHEFAILDEAGPMLHSEATRLWTVKEALVKRDGVGLGQASSDEFGLHTWQVCNSTASRRWFDHWLSGASSGSYAQTSLHEGLRTLRVIPASDLRQLALG